MHIRERPLIFLNIVLPPAAAAAAVEVSRWGGGYTPPPCCSSSVLGCGCILPPAAAARSQLENAETWLRWVAMAPFGLILSRRGSPCIDKPGEIMLARIRQKKTIKINKKTFSFLKVKFLKMFFRDLIQSGLLAHGRRPWAFGPWPMAMGQRPMALGHGPEAPGRGPWTRIPDRIKSRKTIFKKLPVKKRTCLFIHFHVFLLI